MALKLKKSITLEGVSTINSQIAVTMMATISSENQGSTYVSQTVIDQELYSANRRAVRKDLQDFQEAVFEIEDEIEKEIEEGKVKTDLGEHETLTPKEVIKMPAVVKPEKEVTAKKEEE